MNPLLALLLAPLPALDARSFELPCSSRNMPSKEEALAKRLAILAFWVDHPGTGATAIGRACGRVNEATVRSVIKRFGADYKASIQANAPVNVQDAPRSGRPSTKSRRWQRYETQISVFSISFI